LKKVKGFTLIEILVTALLLAILVAIAVPVVVNHRNRALVTEALTALSAIRTAERVYFLENRNYINVSPGSISDIPGIESGDLDGRLFSENLYYVTDADKNGFLAICNIVPTSANLQNSAPKASETESLVIAGGGTFYMSIDQNGQIESNALTVNEASPPQ